MNTRESFEPRRPDGPRPPHEALAPRSGPEPGRDDGAASLLPVVDTDIERLIAAMPLRRPSMALDARIDALLERRAQPWWLRVVPMATAAGLLLAVGFVTGSWVGQARLQGRGAFVGSVPTSPAAGDFNLVHQDSSIRRAGFVEPRTIDLGDDGAVQAAELHWIRTDRFHDPQRGVTIERSYPESWMLVGSPSAD